MTSVQPSRRIALSTVVVAEYDPAIAFFTRALGFELLSDERMGPTKRWVVVAPAGGGGALLLARADGEAQSARIGDQTGGRVAFFLETDDIERDAARMRAEGVTFEEAPRAEPYGRVAVFRDCEGNRWDLIEPVRAR